MTCHFPTVRGHATHRAATTSFASGILVIMATLLSACGSTPPAATSGNPVMSSAPLTELPPIYLQSSRQADDVARCMGQRLFARAQNVDTPRGPAQLIRSNGWDIVIKQQDNGATLVAGDYRDNTKRQAERSEPDVRFAVARCTL
ncbi:hypothetical protein [Robbsia andropogonis]|uniref:hypothetical protein n=1 Tax=Robbsia andropogonis TaxID=28092 RepID=UPI002A6B8670|nr:hypothetical protein [Robbsia andropogonis]